MYTLGFHRTTQGHRHRSPRDLRLVYAWNYLQLDQEDVVAQASNASFDAMTFELWAALLSGATVVGIERDVALDPQELAQALEHYKITTLFLTTALFNQMARELPAAFQHLDYLLFGGQQVDIQSVRTVLAMAAP